MRAGKFSVATLAACASLTMAQHAAAATYIFDFTGAGGSAVASGTIQTSDTLNSKGGYDVTSISGSIAGYGAITGLLANANQPGADYLAVGPGYIAYDNVLYSAAKPPVDFSGVAGSLSGYSFDLWKDIDGTSILTITDGASFFGPSLDGDGNAAYTGTLSVTPAPEPATWAMMIAGLGAVGYVLRRRSGMQGLRAAG